MTVEQVRYWVADEDAVEPAVEFRRKIDPVRRQLGLPTGHIMVADPPPEDGPTIVWQGSYESEHSLAPAEAAISGNGEYSVARDLLSAVVVRTELALSTTADDLGSELRVQE